MSPASALAEAAPVSARTSLAGLTRAELTAALRGVGLPERELRMRAAQLWHWIYFRGAEDFGAMLNISKALRQRLDDAFLLELPEIVEENLFSYHWTSTSSSTAQALAVGDLDCDGVKITYQLNLNAAQEPAATYVIPPASAD